MDIHKVLMKNYSALRIGGEAELVYIFDIRDVLKVVSFVVANNRTLIPLGEGTNSYFGDDLSKYLFVKNEIKGISVEDKGEEVLLTGGAGEKWDDIVRFAVEKNLWGIENLSYIPGSLGAAPVQNIGAYGAELKDTLVSVEAYDLKNSCIVTISREACDFGYRDSLFKKEKNRYIIISVTLKLKKEGVPNLIYKPLDSLLGKQNITLEEIRDTVIATRKEKLPEYKEFPNTGSFFKNPVVTEAKKKELEILYSDMPFIQTGDDFKIPAAWLIEHVAEMKGVRIGDIGTWPKQPLVTVNYGEATFNQVEDFAESIILKIKGKTGIILEKEVNVIV